MNERENILKEISTKRDYILNIEGEIMKLKIELLQITDDVYRYEEKAEVWNNGKKGKRKIETKHIVGRRYWNEFFQDASLPKGEGIWIERSELVMKDGTWYDVDCD